MQEKFMGSDIRSGAGVAFKIVLPVLASLMTSAANAQQTRWTGAEGSSWTNAANWNAGLPVSEGSAIIAADGVQPVLVGEDAAVSTLFMGSSAGSTLSVSNGAELAAGSAIIGNSSINNAPSNALDTQSATLTVTNAGSKLGSGFLNIGMYGAGTIEVTDGAEIDISYSTALGTFETGTGQLSFSGEGTEGSLMGGLVVGDAGDGTMSISDQAKVTSAAATIGKQVTSSSSVEVSGDGSTWAIANGGSLLIGGQGQGELSIIDGGAVSSSGKVFVGNEDTSVGELNISGAGSRLDALDYVALGNEGSGAGAVTDGGILQAEDVIVGRSEGAIGDLIVSGAGSAVNVENMLMVGNDGDAIATISDGASVNGISSNANAVVVIANNSASTATLNIGAAAADAASAAGYINVGTLHFGLGSGELVFNHTGEGYEFDAVIDGIGASSTITHLSGDTLLTADSSLFGGVTNVDGGILRIGNALGGDLHVRGSGTLAGSGMVETVTVEAGGSLSPDGKLTVAGDASFASGSFFRVDADPDGNDLLDVGGTLDLNGGTVVHRASTADFPWLSRYRIATAAEGVEGVFGGVESDLAFMNAELSYDPKDVWLDLVRNDVDFADIALSRNQRNLGAALTGLSVDEPLVRSIMGMSEAGARLAYDQLSGTIHGSTAAAFVQDTAMVRELMHHRIQRNEPVAGADVSRSNRMSFLAEEEPARSGMWMQGFGARSDFSGDGNASGAERSLGGLALGYDQDLANGLTAGLMVGMSSSSVSNDDGAKADADSVTLGAYAGSGGPGLRFGGGAFVSWHDIDTVRSLASVGQGAAIGGYDARTYSIHAEASYDARLAGHRVEPFVSLAHVRHESDGFTETGGTGSLSVEGMSTDTTFTTLGLRGNATMESRFRGIERIVVTGMAGWRHAFGDLDEGVSADLLGSDFVAYGMPIAKNELLLEAGLEMPLSGSSTFSVGYSGQFSEDQHDHRLKAALQVAF